MPIPSSMAGLTIGPRTITLTKRQTMAFAAATGDDNPVYFDDLGPEPPPAPPLLSVSLEWPLVLGLRTLMAGAGPGGAADELRRGVHYTHDATFHRLPRAGETLTTAGRIVLVEPRRSGTYVLLRLDTVDERNAPVFTTYNGGLYREVAMTGERVQLEAPPALPQPAQPSNAGFTDELTILPESAHVYTECADIYNPIHTERSAALAAGLPDIILHGTATLGYAAQSIVNRACAGDATRLARLSARFSAMVFMDTTLLLMADDPVPVLDGGAGGSLGHVGFQVMTEDGEDAIRDGVALVRGVEQRRRVQRPQQQQRPRRGPSRSSPSRR